MRIFAAAALACLIAFSLTAQSGAPGRLSGRRAPSFALPDSYLNYHDILDYRGKVLLLEIIKTDCPVCQKFQRIAQRLEQAYGNKLAVLSIVVPPDNQRTVQNFIATYKVKSPVLMDMGQAVISYVKATPQNPSIDMPHLFLIDGEGMIRNDYVHSPGASAVVFEKEDILMKEVGALVKGLKPSPSGGKKDIL